MSPLWFVDTNVLLDLLTARQPFFTDAHALFDAARNRRVRLATTLTSLATAYYVGCRTTHNPPQVVRTLHGLVTLLTIAPADGAIALAAVSVDWPDFEDALQYFAARAMPEVTALITRDPRGFRAGTLPILSPAEAVQQLAGG